MISFLSKNFLIDFFKKYHIFVLLCALAPWYFILPFTAPRQFASPDETATSVVAQRLANGETASIYDPLLLDTPWLHPRSWVNQHREMVPIGFLTYPWILSVFAFLIGKFVIPFIGTIIILSAIYPAFILLRQKFSLRASILSVLLAGTFPVFVLYANRSLFTQGPQLSLFLWSVLLLRNLREKSTRSLAIVAGAISGFAIWLRPVEAIWIFPWFVLIVWPIRKNRQMILILLFAFIATSIPHMILASTTYGSFWEIGYWLKDTDASVRNIEQITIKTNFFPFGIHPRNILWNVRAFYFFSLLPWTLFVFGVAIAFIQKNKKKILNLFSVDRKKFLIPIEMTNIILMILVFWTVIVLLTLYGSGLYFDHVRRNAITLGNSFLRYTLLFTFAISWCSAWFMDALPNRAKKYGVVFCLILSTHGLFHAMVWDEESVWNTRIELIRYTAIHAQSEKWFHPQDIIFSERSDKIFFPLYRGVSPLPTPDQAKSLLTQTNVQVGLFARPLSQAQRDLWREAGFSLKELTAFGKETLYLLKSKEI